MDGHETSRDIEETAAQWVARMDRAPLSELDERRLQNWLRADPRRRGALMRAQALWLWPDLALAAAGEVELKSEPADVPPTNDVVAQSRAPRKYLLQWGGAIAASLLLAVFLFVSVPVPTAYATAKGEMRRIPLADGSALTLNTDSRVHVYDDDGHLRVAVRRGEVFVEAATSGTPLQVEVDGRRFDAMVATFVVRKLDGKPAQVVVQDGKVELPSSDASVTAVAANTRVSMPVAHGGMTVVSLSADQMHRELAWREGKLAFHGESLAEAAAAFGRYSDTRIVIADAELAHASVTGLFAANNPTGFSRAVATVFDAQARQEQGRIIITRKN